MIDWRTASLAVTLAMVGLAAALAAGVWHARTAVPDRRMPGYDHWMHERGPRP